MTEQELVKVVEMIAGLGDGAQEAFKWYLIADLVPSFMGFMVSVIVVGVGYKLIFMAIQEARVSTRSNDYLSRIAILLKCPFYGSITPSEFTALESAIKKLQKEAAE